MMAKTFYCLLGLCAIVLLASQSVWADTDYHCLNQCVSSQKGEAVCMKQCTYNLPGQLDENGKPIAKATPMPEAHRVFTQLTPIDPSKVLVDHKAPSEYVTSLDHRCMSQCLLTKLEYQACASSCRNVSTNNGDTLISAGTTQTVPQMMNYYNMKAEPLHN